MENFDQLIREALQSEERASEKLNRKLAQDMAEQAGLTLGESGRRRGRWMRPAAVFLCAAVVLCTAPAAYAMVRGIDIAGLFTKLWDFSGEKDHAASGGNGAGTSRGRITDIQDNHDLEALEKICSDVSVIKERSTFQNIRIEPAMAVSDMSSLYLVLRITGDKKLISENNIGFCLEDAIFKTEKGAEIVDNYQDYLLAAKGNVIYYAMKVEYTVEEKKDTGKYFLKVGNLYYADDIDNMGRIKKYKTDKDGRPLVAQEGEYEVTFSVPISEEKVTAAVDGMEVAITALNARFLGGKDVFESKVDQKTWTRTPEAYLLMKDGSKVEVIPHTTMAEGDMLCDLKRPVDTKQIRSLEFHGKEYPIN